MTLLRYTNILYENNVMIAKARAGGQASGIWHCAHAEGQRNEPATGEVRWTSRVQGAQHGMGDLLVPDGQDVYLMNMRLDAQSGEITEIDYSPVPVEREWKRTSLRRVGYPQGVRYLRSGLATISLLVPPRPRRHRCRRRQAACRAERRKRHLLGRLERVQPAPGAGTPPHWRKPDLGLFEFEGSKANNIV